MKKILCIATLLLSQTGFAKFSFKVERDSKGELLQVALHVDAQPKAETILKRFQSDLQSSNFLALEIPLENFSDLKPEEQAGFNQAIANVQNELNSLFLQDAKLTQEFKRSFEALEKNSAFTLLASRDLNAFDQEALYISKIEATLNISKEVLGITPAFALLEFFVREHLDNLIAKREFFQNALLRSLEVKSSSFSSSEKSKIKSSIFYSRLSLLDLKARKNAKKNWLQFGKLSSEKWGRRCLNGDVVDFSKCFYIKDTRYYSLVDRNNSLSKKDALSFDPKKPHTLGQKRKLLFLARLGLKMTPLPGIIKEALAHWIHSHYREQRRTEGLLFQNFILKNDLKSADLILKNSLNPLIH